MNGHQSDLRTGLPLQMVEIHEPMRLLVIVDATPEALLAVAGRQAEVAELVVNEWVQLVSVDPATGAMAVFEDGALRALRARRRRCCRSSSARRNGTCARATTSPPALVRSALPETGGAGPGTMPRRRTSSRCRVIDAASAGAGRSPSSRRSSRAALRRTVHVCSATTTRPSPRPPVPWRAGLLLSIAGGLLALASRRRLGARRVRRGRVRRSGCGSATTSCRWSASSTRCRSRSPLFASVLTALVARFSRTYLHKEPGFVRFFALLGLFATGTQLVAFAGALELFFAGWEIIGIASALFIGFFHERDEPVRSAVRAFSTYRLSDAGLLIATVTTFELLGSARFSSLDGRGSACRRSRSTVLALLFLLSAMGKSAQLPVLGLAAARDGRAHAVERAVLRRRVDPRRPVPAAARLAGVRGVAGRARRRRGRGAGHRRLRRGRGPGAHRRQGRAGARHAGAGRADPGRDLPGLDHAGADAPGVPRAAPRSASTSRRPTRSTTPTAWAISTTGPTGSSARCRR